MQPRFANWLRVRALELEQQGEHVVVLVLWGRMRFTVSKLPTTEPEFAIRRFDGSIERAPFV